MKITVTAEKPIDDKVAATVTVPAADVDKAIAKTYKDIAKKYNFQGFRRGHAPRPVIDGIIGRESVLAQATNDLLNAVEPMMLEELDVTPVGRVSFGEEGADPQLASARPDAILLVRGGGSFEDLMCFNDESVARAVAACPVPVVTGIGHEPDTTIADMVADRRASTPTAAAESVAPAIDEVERQMLQRQVRLGRAMSAALEFRAQRADALARLMSGAMDAGLSRRRMEVEAMGARRCLTDPLSPVRDREADLMQTEQRLHDAIPRALARDRESTERAAARLLELAPRLLRPAESTLARLAASLDALSPLSVLARGYAIARDGAGHVVKDAAALSCGDDVRVLLGTGSFDATVTAVND